jgi:hypothetical protein
MVDCQSWVLAFAAGPEQHDELISEEGLNRNSCSGESTNRRLVFAALFQSGLKCDVGPGSDQFKMFVIVVNTVPIPTPDNQLTS